MADIVLTLIGNPDKKALKDAYAQAIADLDAILVAQNPTNAQVIQAIKTIADHQKKLLNFIKNQINGQ